MARYVKVGGGDIGMVAGQHVRRPARRGGALGANSGLSTQSTILKLRGISAINPEISLRFAWARNRSPLRLVFRAALVSLSSH